MPFSRADNYTPALDIAYNPVLEVRIETETIFVAGIPEKDTTDVGGMVVQRLSCEAGYHFPGCLRPSSPSLEFLLVFNLQSKDNNVWFISDLR